MIPSSSRGIRFFWGALCCAGSLTVGGNVRASQTYPANIEAYWRIASLPVSGQGCKLCHASDLGGSGTVVQPFGKTLRAQGLMPEDPTSLYEALGYVTQHSVVTPLVDSDGDGVPDFDEIVNDHTNPNDPQSFVEPMTQPPSNGGEGGEGPSGSNASGAGGQGSVQTPEPPVFEPPSAAELPPPFVHGCSLAPSAGSNDALVAALAAAVALVRRRARARR